MLIKNIFYSFCNVALTKNGNRIMWNERSLTFFGIIKYGYSSQFVLKSQWEEFKTVRTDMSYDYSNGLMWGQNYWFSFIMNIKIACSMTIWHCQSFWHYSRIFPWVNSKLLKICKKPVSKLSILIASSVFLEVFFTNSSKLHQNSPCKIRTVPHRSVNSLTSNGDQNFRVSLISQEIVCTFN